MKRKSWVLFVALLLQLIFNPCAATDAAQGASWIIMALNCLVMVAIIYRLSFLWYHTVVAVVLGIPIIVIYWLPSTLDYQLVLYPLVGVLYLYAIGVMIHSLLRVRQIGLDELLGAFAIYILVGLGWALLYEYIELLSPGSYLSETGHPQLGEFIYFSFTTLTTLGYGDITPISCVARILSTLEAMSGLLVLSVVIGRMIGISTAKIVCGE